MLEPDSKQKDMTTQRRNPRALNLIPDLDVPPLVPRWFHAIDNPIIDPISIRRAKSSSTLNNTKIPKSPSKLTPSKWVPFSKRDSEALEKAYQNNDIRAKVPVNEDHLFEVDVMQRTISPVYWEGPTYEVRRATWFMQADGWVPCEENIAEQIELGYYKHKPYKTVASSTVNEDAEEEKQLEISLSKQSVDKQWNLLGPYLGQYIVYTGENKAWLLSNSTSSKLAKSIITRLTNKHNLGGIRLIRGYPKVEELTKKSKTTRSSRPSTPVNNAGQSDEELNNSSSDDESNTIKQERQKMERNEAVDYDNENSEEEVRKIDHLMFVIHGVGQKMSERTGQTFVHDVNVMRKTMKLAYNAAIASTSAPTKPNGIQLLPIMWRQDIKFGMAADGEGYEADLGTVGMEDGCPTLDELTLEGVPNIRTVVSDVLMDIPLYMTPRYRELMTQIIAKELNRVYRLFCNRNPEFEKKGKVSIFGHSLGSLLAFDVLTLQPVVAPPDQHIDSKQTTDKKLPPPLLFPVQNFFAAGSPLGVILLLRGFKIASRKALAQSNVYNALSDIKSPSPISINFCYPAVENLYNIFHKSDPVAYRLEPLIARHYTSKLKPEYIPYMKGGLKGVIDASFNVGSGIANRAGAMYESIKMGLTTNLFMRGLGLSRQQIYEDMHSTSKSPDNDNDNSNILASTDEDNINRLTRVRSNSDPTRAFSSSDETNFQFGHKTADKKSFSLNGKSAIRKESPSPILSHNTSSSSKYSQGVQKLKMMNKTGRVDYCLKEGLLENPYLSAFSAHMQYWQDVDVAAFLVRQIYYNDND